MQPLSSLNLDRDRLAGVVVVAELIVDAVDKVIDTGDGLELDFSQNGAFEGFGERLVDFLGSGELGRLAWGP